MKHKYLAAMLCFLIAVSLWSCREDFSEEDYPSYLYVQPFSFSVSDPEKEGSASADISYGWVYVNNQYYGAFELPAEIPVLAQGPSDIRIFPGVRYNASNVTPQVNPFYLSHQETRSLTGQQIDTIQPTSTYNESSFFAFREDFQGGQSFRQDIGGLDVSHMNITTDPEQAFEGRSGFIEVDEDTPYKRVFADEIFPGGGGLGVPENGNPLLIELDYRGDVDLHVGIQGYDSEGFPLPNTFLVLRPSETWKKAYFDASPTVERVGQIANFYRIYLAASGTSQGQATARTYVDNVKLVYFQEQ